ncbi:CopD family protein [Neptuniibacter halophilus]|uniref:CopD family protein n=1 Tax=Neptuniibacter halophilus TaxID=651666 RepID=UPI0025722811|nr:CopD family protein [Neptuniibacter halophilus]
MSIALPLHLLAAIIWVGGMFFAYVCLRPVAAELLEAPQRLQLWCGVFRRFFTWVGIAILTLIISGHGMIALFGGFAQIGIHVHIMLATGYLMMLIFGHLYFSPFKKLKRAVAAQEWPAAGKQLNTIRKIVGINLGLGLFTAVVATGGKFFF